MNNRGVSRKFSNIQPFNLQPSEPSLELVVFSIGKLNLALQIESVYKITNYEPIYADGLGYVGVAHIDDQEITVVNLYQRLFKSQQSDESPANNCLLIVQNSKEELFGIPVIDTPKLIEVPLSQIRGLPEAYRRADTLEIASHVAVIPQAETKLTLFVVDVDQLC